MTEQEVKDYNAFLEQKKQTRIESGFQVEESELNPMLFDFQKYCVRRALQAGKFAMFEDCGLGKTIQQLEWANKVVNHINKPVLILAPLAVVSQTIKEGEKFGYNVNEVIDRDDVFTPNENCIYITNYDNMEHVDVKAFGGIVLDESSILKNFQGKTRTKLIEDFRNTPYKLACTATPSPNDTTEICNHAEFLDVMSRNEMLAMYFVHDGGSTSEWRLKGHATQAFWDFVSTWAVMLNKPSDIGFDNSGYSLPPLNVVQEIVETPKRDNGMLFNTMAVNATDFHKELRETCEIRLNRVVDIVNAHPQENFIIWIGQDNEGKYLRDRLPDAIEVKGSDSKAYKKEKLLGFGRGEFRVLITKLKIAQFGLNYQNCHNQIYASLDFSFEATYQGIRRSYRFGQTEQVNIYLITTDTMQNVKDSFDKKNYQVSNGKGNYNYFPILKHNEMHIWTIQDAKDGDVIQLGKVTAIFKKYIGREKCICYCSFCKNGGFEIPIENGEDNVYGCHNAAPATREQHNVLMNAMNNAGYEWDGETKELKKKCKS